jgi:hypothetical protein
MPDSPPSPAQVLEDAADLLLVHGRCTGKGIDANGSMCVRGAIAKAEGKNPALAVDVMGSWTPALRELEARLPDLAPVHIARKVADFASWETTLRAGRWPSWVWNDDPEVTDDEVRDVLLLAAKDIRNEAAAG